MAPSSHPHPIPARALIGPLALLALQACGGAGAPQPARPETPPEPFAHLTVIQAGPPAAPRFVHYGVHPTVDTAEEPLSALTPSRHTASFAWARAALDAGQLPPEAAVRVEDFLNHVAPLAAPPPPGAAPLAVHAERFESPHRPGYHLLRLALTARAEPASPPPPVHLTLIIDVGHPAGLPPLRAALTRLATEWGPADTLRLVAPDPSGTLHLALPATPATAPAVAAALAALRPAARPQPEAALALGAAAHQTSRALPGHHPLILCSDGAALPDAARAAEQLAGVDLTLIGLDGRPADDHRLHQLALAAGAAYHAAPPAADPDALTAALRQARAPALRDLRLELRFHPERVSRYRLLGYERHAARAARAGRGGPLGAGETLQILYEIKPLPTQGPLADLRVTLDHAGRPHTLRAPLAPRAAPPSPAGRLSLVAAGLAEKLRAAYWARHLSYADLLVQLDALPAPWQAAPAARELRHLIETARRLDRRPDRFAGELPLSQMSFDQVPVTR